MKALTHLKVMILKVPSLRTSIVSIFFLYFCFIFLGPVIPLAESATPSSKYGGQLVLSTNSDPKSFNDILAKETSSTLVTNLIFEGLTTTNAYTTKVEPNLALMWEVSEDGLSWIFFLRQDVRWSDGEPFTADDVVFTFNDLIFNPDVPNSAKDVFTIEGKIFLVERVDDYTVRFTLPVKFAPFLRGMGQAILPKHKLEKALRDGKFNFTWGIDTDPKEIVGTGPYRLIKYVPGQKLEFERNPLYWKKSSEGENLPFMDKIIYLIVQNPDVELLKFLEGTLDYYALRGMDYSLVKPLEKQRNFTVYDMGPATGSNFLAFNLNPGKNPKTQAPYVDPVKLAWFSNLDFRRAIAHAIDKARIIEIVNNGLGYPQDSPIGPGEGFFYNPGVPKYDYDLKEAADILDAAGFKDTDGDGVREDASGHKIEFNLYTNSNGTERMDIAAIIRYDLEKLGMKVNFQGLEFNTLVGKLTSTFQWDTIVLGLTGGLEPHFGKNVWSSDGQLHLWNPHQEKPATDWERRVDDLFTQGVQELDENKRKVIYDEFQEIVSNQIPVVYTVLSARLAAVRNRFENLHPTNYGGVFHNLEEIYIKPEFRR